MGAAAALPLQYFKKSCALAGGLHVIFVEVARRTWLLPLESLWFCIDGSSNSTSLAISQEVSSFGRWLGCDSARSQILFRCPTSMIYLALVVGVSSN